MSVPSFIRVQVQFTIQTCRTIIRGIIIKDIVFIPITTVDVREGTIFYFPARELVGRVPSGTALMFQVFTSRVPVFFRSPLEITRHIHVFTLSGQFISISLTVFFAAFVITMRQTVSVNRFTYPYLFMLRNA